MICRATWMGLAIGWLAGGAAALAQPLPAADAEADVPTPRYQVEVIFFAHADGNPNEELFGHGAATPASDGAIPGAPAPRPSPAEPPIAIDPFDGTVGAAGDSSTSTASPDPRLGPIDAQPPGADASTAADPGAGLDPFETIDPFGTLGDRASDASDRNGGFSFRVLTPDELELGGAHATLERLGAYRVLGHGGWIQDALDETDARALDVGYLGITNPRGSIRLYVGRFLHVAVDLEYQQPAASGAGAVGPAVPGRAGDGSGPGADDPFGFGRPARTGIELSEIPVGPRYRLETERNAIRSGELHYIDHPLFGVLVLVQPAPEPEPAPFDDTGVLLPAA